MPLEEENIKVTNSLLSALNLTQEKLIIIKENGLADANFILTNLMQQFFSDVNSKICLVIMHNTLGHYNGVMKKLGCNFIKKITDGFANTIEPLKIISDALSNENQVIDFFSQDKEGVVRELFLNINNKIKELLKTQPEGHVYLIIDDVSHLLDLGIDVKFVVIFLNYCANLISNRITVIMNCHVGNETDEIISNSLSYVADIEIEVSPLKTGVSHDVTGVIKITRRKEDVGVLSEEKVYHYKAHEMGIQVFSPGQSIFYLIK